MTPEEAARNARAEAEAMMKSRCTIRERGSGTVTDPETGQVIDNVGPVVYTGKCKVRPAATWGRTAEAGGEQIAPSSFIVSIPFRVSNVERNHLVVILASQDPWLVGRKFQVRFSPAAGDYISARRLICEESSNG